MSDREDSKIEVPFAWANREPIEKCNNFNLACMTSSFLDLWFCATSVARTRVAELPGLLRECLHGAEVLAFGLAAIALDLLDHFYQLNLLVQSLPVLWDLSTHLR